MGRIPHLITSGKLTISSADFPSMRPIAYGLRRRSNGNRCHKTTHGYGTQKGTKTIHNRSFVLTFPSIKVQLRPKLVSLHPPARFLA